MTRNLKTSDLMHRRVGEDRPKVRRVVMEVTMTVTVEWPEGIEFDEEECKWIAASAASQRFGRDVGSPGKIVWAEAYCECSDDDVEIIEDEEIE